MPLLHFHIIRNSRTPEQLRALMNATHEIVVKAFGVPQRDRYQLVSEHEPSHMIVEDTGLDIPRTGDVLLLQVFSSPRTKEQLETFYRLLAEHLEAACGLASSDLMVSVVPNGREHWSFGMGRAQFLTGEL